LSLSPLASGVLSTFESDLVPWSLVSVWKTYGEVRAKTNRAASQDPGLLLGPPPCGLEVEVGRGVTWSKSEFPF
jgi:hypothetical protein